MGSEPQDRRLASQIPGPVRQHALALEAALQEDTTGAFRAVQDGLSEVSEQVETFDDPSLRAHAARAGERLAAFGLGLAVRDGSVEEVFEWSERWRVVTAPAHAGSPAGIERVRAQLGAGSLVEFVTHEESLLAVLISERRVLLRRLADIREVKESIVRLRYSLRRHTRPGDVEAAAADVERLVLQPLLAELGNGPLVAVPVGALHTLPWGALPCLRERPVSVAASASAWMRARNLERALHDGPPVVVAAAGPSLAHAHAEVAHVLACHPGGRESPARTADVLRALRTADVLHLAAHGVFHARSPLVSGITLEDGPLMAYDLLEAPRSPELVVLSACNSGMSRAPVDGAPLGLPGTFLAKGASCVVAGLVPVRDEAARAMMGVFHELVVAGRSPDAALACAAAKTGEHAFVCFGAGDRALY
ncbi:CHAT domain-containing protein [Nonomuraea longispora]|uniref:CHAT domain-containing protein n=1 Tax=Nonomuraea longispora TaxID=1848320 RepID=A0A4R4N3Z1_9ACTN|nr:CHAT domain-containing protein [Nonomuraea longispora]